MFEEQPPAPPSPTSLVFLYLKLPSTTIMSLGTEGIGINILGVNCEDCQKILSPVQSPVHIAQI